jgi:hypothetical protein
MLVGLAWLREEGSKEERRKGGLRFPIVHSAAAAAFVSSGYSYAWPRERERARDMRVVCCGKGGRTDDGAVEVLDGVADGLVGAGIADLL